MALVLIVDDSPTEVHVMQKALEEHGFSTVAASDGSEAIRKARELHPDLILMDMSLPVMDGWEATRTLKAAEETRDIPVIALTAHAMSTDRDKALEAGCDDYDTKPIELTRLLSKMQVLLGGERRTGERRA